MITTYCQCGNVIRLAESEVNAEARCASCNALFRHISAESIPVGAGAADFDARLTILSGPDRVGESFPLGGVSDIQIGKLSDKQIPLGGSKVSRFHCRLVRKDFAPSRWELHDNRSTNGIFINAHRIDAQELRDGDTIQIGEYTARFNSTYHHDIAAAKAAEAKSLVAAGGSLCPSCGQVMRRGSKICVNCGVNLETGKSLVVSRGMDEDDLAIRADTWTRVLSWFIPLGLFPIASEAFGTRKPISTWIIFSITTLASIVFLFMVIGNDNPSAATLNLLQWSGNPEGTDEDLAEGVRFRWYQLLTSAMLHEPTLLMPFIMHLGGNMLFLLVFGLRVNELIGNLRMAIIYPLLAVTSGLAHHISMRSGPLTPSLGASGAVMGLAGMYFVFFPVQKVFMIIWFRGGMLTGWRCLYKIFRMRGFWLLLLWIGLNDFLPMLLADSDSVAHWAHVGGFVSGMIVAIALLIARQANARGGDLLSVLLGKRAWALVGKPSDWHGVAEPAM